MSVVQDLAWLLCTRAEFLQSLQSTPQQTEHCGHCGNITGSNNFQPFPTKWLEGKGAVSI